MLKRRDGVALDEFLEACQRRGEQVATLPAVIGYIQSVPLPRSYRRQEPLFDALEEIEFRDLNDLREVTKGCDLQAELAAIVDPIRQRQMVIVEHVVKEGAVPEGALKNIEFAMRRSDLDLDTFQDHWRNAHGPLAATIPVLLRYVQCYPCEEGNWLGAPPFDGLAFTWFADIQSMRESATTREYLQTRADEPRFVAPDLDRLITTERSFASTIQRREAESAQKR